MKKIYPFLTVLCVFLWTSAIAQPTLTSGNTAPQIGDSYNFQNIDITGLSAAPSGANVTWDFSTVSGTSSATINFVDPATTPNASSFPNADIAQVLSSLYDYYESTSSSYSRIGVDNSAQIIAYTNPQLQLSFPMTYGAMFVDSFTATISGTIPILRSGTITAEADGYGTLITPGGTFQNVLKIKYVEDYQDEINGTPFSQYDSEIYVWYQPGTHYPLFSMTSITISGAGTTSYGSYMEGTSVSAPFAQSLAKSMTLYPNPASSRATLAFSLGEVEELRIRLLTATGQEVRNTSLGKSAPGVYREAIDLSGLAAGMYFVRLEGKNLQQTLPLVVE